MSLAKKYAKSYRKKWSLRLKTTNPDGDNFDGVVTQIERGFIAMREATDFEFDGIVILPKRVIKGYRDNDREACFNRILAHNGQIKHARSPKWLKKCPTISDVLHALKKRDIWPAVEIVSGPKGKKKSFLYVGPVTKVRANTVDLICHDAAGKWEAEYELRIASIFKIEFDSKYCNHFNAYMRSL